MPQPASLSSFDDNQLLLAAQSGNPDARNGLISRFDRLLRVMVGRVCPFRAAHHRDFVDDVVAHVYLWVVDPNVQRYVPKRGKASQYLFGLVLNAIRTISRQRQSVCEVLDTAITDVDEPHGSEPIAMNLRSATLVYHNYMENRMMTEPNLACEDEELISLVFDGTDTATEAMVKTRYLNDSSLADIGRDHGIVHTTVARRIDQFLRNAEQQLARAGAA